MPNAIPLDRDELGEPPEYLRPFADWTFDDFLREALEDGIDEPRARRHAAMYAWRVGDLCLGAVPVVRDWILHRRPWFANGGEVAYVTSRGRKHQLIDRNGQPIGPEQRDLAAMIAWLGANGWVTL